MLMTNNQVTGGSELKICLVYNPSALVEAASTAIFIALARRAQSSTTITVAEALYSRYVRRLRMCGHTRYKTCAVPVADHLDSTKRLHRRTHRLHGQPPLPDARKVFRRKEVSRNTAWSHGESHCRRRSIHPERL